MIPEEPNDLTDILANFVHVLGLDRARAYEYISEPIGIFEARAEIGGTAKRFPSYKNPFFITVNAEKEPISYLTYHTKEASTYRRGERRLIPVGNEFVETTITFGCDMDVGSKGLDYLIDIPLLGRDDQMVGKITADNIRKDPKGKEHLLSALLGEKRPQMQALANMAARAIQRVQDIRLDCAHKVGNRF